MTPPRAAFERGVRRLDPVEARRFVADLFEARGYRTAVEGRVVTATDGSGESTRLLVVDGVRSLAAAAAEHGADAVLVTDGRLEAVAGSLTARVSSGQPGSDPAPVLGPGTLYEWFAYAVDPESRSALADGYLDATEPTALGRAATALSGAVRTVAGRLGRLRRPSRRTAGVVLATLLVLLAAAAVGPVDPLPTAGPRTTGDAGPTPDVTAVPVTATPTPAETEAGVPLPDVCPPPPVGDHPAVLRPPVRQTATANGLDGWRILAAQNTTMYEFDPNDQQAHVVPEVRHLAVYESPSGATFRLGIDRWESPDRAETAARAGLKGLGFPWGAYTAWVEWVPDRPTHEAAAANLLAEISAPGGTRLGGACVSAIATASGTNATSAIG